MRGSLGVFGLGLGLGLPKGVFGAHLFTPPVPHVAGHWLLLAVLLEAKRVEYYNSIRSPDQAQEYMHVIWKYLLDVWKAETGSSMSVEEMEKWKFCAIASCPQQDNGFDCGVFVCAFSLCLTHGVHENTFTQEDMPFFREHIALSIQEGRLTTFLTYP